jgi:hypothetical protein
MQKMKHVLALMLVLVVVNIAFADDNSNGPNCAQLIGTYDGEVPFVSPEGFMTFGIQFDFLEIQDCRIKAIVTIFDENGDQFLTDDFNAIVLPGRKIYGASNASMMEGRIIIKKGVPVIEGILRNSASKYETDVFPPLPELTKLFPAVGYITAAKID